MTDKLNLIAGDWVAGDNGTTANINPSDVTDIVGHYASGSKAQAEAAIEAAAQAFRLWSRTTPQVRHDVLERVGQELAERREEIGTLLAREEGKTKAEGIGETLRAAQIFKFFAGETLRNAGDLLDSVRPGVETTVTREPLGVIGLITPWNFPIAIPAWKIAPALAYGNTVVLKPADLVPGSAWALAEIIDRALKAVGAPAGVFNLVMGPGSVVGQAILENRKVAAVSFTGSVGTGARVAQACVTRGARFQLEMGGKNPMVVLDDADLSTAVEACVNGAFFSTGQRCTASSRLIVTAGIHDRFVEAVVKRLEGVRVGHALAADTHIGPVVDARQLAQDEEYVAIGKAEGAELAFGGKRLTRDTEGFYLEPALFVGATNQMRISREEIFGPVASVIKVADYEEALAVANDTEFGLSAGICTSSLKAAQHFKRNAEAGMVMVNLPTAGVDYHVPFGGRKGSSYGPREQGRYAVEFYTTVKTTYTAG